MHSCSMQSAHQPLPTPSLGSSHLLAFAYFLLLLPAPPSSFSLSSPPFYLYPPLLSLPFLLTSLAIFLLSPPSHPRSVCLSPSLFSPSSSHCSLPHQWLHSWGQVSPGRPSWRPQASLQTDRQTYRHSPDPNSCQSLGSCLYSEDATISRYAPE